MRPPRPAGLLLAAIFLLSAGALPTRARFGLGGRETELDLYRHFVSGELAALDGDWETAREEFREALSYAPNSPEVLSALAEACLHLGDFTQSEKYASRAVVIDPFHERALRIMVELAFREGTLDDVESALERLLSVAGDDLEARLRLGLVRAEMGDDTGVIDAFESYPSRSPGSERAFFRLGVAYADLGRNPEAIGAFERAMEEAPGMLDAALNIAIIRENAGENEEAFDAYERALAISPRNREVLRRLVRLGLLLGRYEETLDYLGTYRTLVPHSEEVERLMATLSVRTGRLGEAAEILADLARESGDLSGLLEAAAFAETASDTDLVISILSSAAALSPEEPSLRIALASFLASAGRFDEALEAASRGVELAPRDTTALWTLAVTYESMGDTSSALETFLRYREIDPNRAVVNNYIGYSWAVAGIRLDEAERLIRLALEEEPESPFYRDSLGWVYFRMGRIEEAREEIERALEGAPGDPTMTDHLGDVLWKMGLTEEALERWREALDAGGGENADDLPGKISAAEEALGER